MRLNLIWLLFCGKFIQKSSPNAGIFTGMSANPSPPWNVGSKYSLISVGPFDFVARTGASRLRPGLSVQDFNSQESSVITLGRRHHSCRIRAGRIVPQPDMACLEQAKVARPRRRRFAGRSRAPSFASTASAADFPNAHRFTTLDKTRSAGSVSTKPAVRID
jgi:hypothetical protein